MTTRPEAPALVWRVRLLAVCLGLGAIAFRQSSGLIVPDTKLDLTADPGGFLARALHLWDPQGALGQLQNQAYGYLFPVGPFHLVLDAIGLPAWAIQRLWWTTILCVAFLGMWRLAKALGVAHPWVRIAVAVGYALSPRIVSEVAVTSVEVWPMAMAPWVLLPLVVPGRSVRWRACWSGVAVALLGGVNAVATGAVLVLPVLWLLTRHWDRALLRLAGAWSAAVLAACAWWLAPLIVLGGYSPPFLSWIEDASVTTSTASVFQAFRGVSAWLSFLAGPTGPTWPAGWLYAVSALLVIATSLVAVLGLVGLLIAPARTRGFLLLAVVVGLGLLTLGHIGPGASFGAGTVQTLLDGPLAPFRNTHKFDLVVRVPLTIGLGLLLQRAADHIGSGVRVRRPAAVLPVIVTSLVVVVAAPGIGASMARAEGYRSIPSYWHSAAAWLDAQPGDGAVFVTPAANFSDLTWGSTKDEPLQALSRRPFVVRDAVPLGSAGATRMLDSIENRLGAGQQVLGLTDVLAGAGIAFVLVRNDIRLDAQGNPPLAVHRALLASGLARVAGFGPPSGAYGESASVTVDYRTLIQHPSIEVYAVGGASDARVVPTRTLLSATGGPENLLQLAAQFGPRDALLGKDAGSLSSVAAGALQVLTDGQRRREVNFGSASRNTSALLEANDPGRSGRAVIDYEAGGGAGTSHLGWDGVAGVEASSSASDAGATLRTGPENGPQAALDGDPSTRWLSGTYGVAAGEWLQVDFKQAVSLAGTTATFSGSWPVGARPSVVRVETERGVATSDVFAGPAQRLVTPPGTTRWLRLKLLEVTPGAANGFSVAELQVPGVTPAPTTVLPTAAMRPDVVLLEEGVRGRSECLKLHDDTWCSPTLGVEAEETGFSRAWTSPGAAEYTFAGRVRPRDGAAVEALLSLPSGWSATASSTLVAAPSGRPAAGIDADPATGWVASPTDPAPWFDIRLPWDRLVTGLRILKSYELPASTPLAVHVEFDDGSTVTASADESGEIALPARTTRSLRLTFGDVRLLENIDSGTGTHSFAPVGFSELIVHGAEDLVRPIDASAPTGVPCGFGPTIFVNGTRHLTSVAGTVGDLLAGRDLAWQTCGDDRLVDLTAGRNRVDATPSAEFVPSSLRLVAPGLLVPPDESRAAPVSRVDAARVRFALPARAEPSVLVVAQNFNRGWAATDGNGRVLEPIRVNGWQQGWVLPAGAASVVDAHFGPDTLYRWGLLAGGLALMALFVATLRVGRGRPALREQSAMSGRYPIGLALALVVIAGGPLGMASAILAVATAWLLRDRPRPARVGAVGLSVLLVTVAATLTARTPWPASDAGVSSGAGQGAVWLAVAVTLAFALSSTWPGSRWPDRLDDRTPRTRRISGRSIP